MYLFSDMLRMVKRGRIYTKDVRLVDQLMYARIPFIFPRNDLSRVLMPDKRKKAFSVLYLQFVRGKLMRCDGQLDNISGWLRMRLTSRQSLFFCSLVSKRPNRLLCCAPESMNYLGLRSSAVCFHSTLLKGIIIIRSIFSH